MDAAEPQHQGRGGDSSGEGDLQPRRHPVLLVWTGCRVAREPRPGCTWSESLVRPACGVGDRAEAGMSISPTPLMRRELLPFCRNQLLVDLRAVNLLRVRRKIGHARSRWRAAATGPPFR